MKIKQLREEIKLADHAKISGKFGEVRYPERADCLPGVTPDYAGFKIYSNGNRYEVWLHGESRWGSSYDSVESAVEAIDKMIEDAQSHGRLLYLKRK